MDNKEAIELLKPLTDYSVDKNGIGTFPMVSTPLQVEALDLAIQALKLSESINELSSCIGTRLYTSDKQITIEEYMQRLKGERQ